MNDQLKREFARWLESDRAGQDDDADAAFQEVFAGMHAPRQVPLTFAAATMARLAEVRAAEARRARRARLALLWGGATAGPIALYFGAGALMSAAASLLVGAVNLMVSATVGIAGASDWSIWSLMGSLGRALAAVMSDADVTLVVIAMHGIAFAALVALQRLLGPDTEPYK